MASSTATRRVLVVLTSAALIEARRWAWEALRGGTMPRIASHRARIEVVFSVPSGKTTGRTSAESLSGSRWATRRALARQPHQSIRAMTWFSMSMFVPSRPASGAGRAAWTVR